MLLEGKRCSFQYSFSIITIKNKNNSITCLLVRARNTQIIYCFLSFLSRNMCQTEKKFVILQPI